MNIFSWKENIDLNFIHWTADRCMFLYQELLLLFSLYDVTFERRHVPHGCLLPKGTLSGIAKKKKRELVPCDGWVFLHPYSIHLGSFPIDDSTVKENVRSPKYNSPLLPACSLLFFSNIQMANIRQKWNNLFLYCETIFNKL